MKLINKRDLVKLLENDQSKNWKIAFLYAYQVKHINPKDPKTNYMYMGYDNEKQLILFKDKYTRQYHNLAIS